MRISRRFADKRTYGEKRSTDDIQYIVVQTISNTASSHYFIRDNEAIQLIPDEYMSNAINGARIGKDGILHGICTKYNSISIGVPYEMSDDVKQMCLNLVMTIKQRYKICNENIVRKTDVTGESNPEAWYDNDRWTKDIKNKLIEF